jgi:hypothetical protein
VSTGPTAGRVRPDHHPAGGNTTDAAAAYRGGGSQRDTTYGNSIRPRVAAALLGLLTTAVLGFFAVTATDRGIGVMELLMAVVVWSVMSAVWWIVLARTVR